MPATGAGPFSRAPGYGYRHTENINKGVVGGRKVCQASFPPWVFVLCMRRERGAQNVELAEEIIKVSATFGYFQITKIKSVCR